MNDQEYTLLKRAILRLLSIDLHNYKTQQMHRRLDGLVSSNAKSVGEYCKLIEQDKDALDKLKNFLTINVSEFFRDKDQFNILKETILPGLLKQTARLNIWSAGCSHGGEPYSLAMLLQEMAPGQNHRILATDLDGTILKRAANGGPYTDQDVSNVEPRYLLKYFTRTSEGYHVIDGLKKRIEFRQHNMLSEPFSQGFDLIICRNVVIYFSDEAKETLYRGFYNSLKDHGVLFIGATETLLGANNIGFERMHNCYYAKAGSDRKAPVKKLVTPPLGR